ncbi:MAG: GlcG/HbpS family heme-binding protein [Acetobacteraceae bacterium]
MSQITLAQASKIVDGALAAGRENSFKPLTVVVLDSGGHLVAAKREDESGILRFEIAFGKAFGALGFGLGSRALATRAAKAPMFVTAVASVAEGRMVPVAGGVLIRDAANAVVGAVGISGDNSDHDEAAAIAGIGCTGLTADPGA